MQCLHEDGHADTRICQFDNMLLHKQQLLYLYSGICYAWETVSAAKACHCTHQVHCALFLLFQLRLTKGITGSMAACQIVL